jgi:hypothetical protein
MPSPFPGMDPYLEGHIWMSFHTQMAVEIARQLTPKVRPRYGVLTVERFVTEDPETVMPERIPHVTVEIRFVDNRELVTAIELLSPSNKVGTGRREYLAKRSQILLSDVHLLEIDLLRNGQRVPMQQPLPDAPYFVLLSRAGRRPLTEVWPIAWDAPLPEVPVPLLPPDDEVRFDLQLAFRSVYDDFAYDVNIDYQDEPKMPLSDEQKSWINARLRAVGLRT